MADRLTELVRLADRLARDARPARARRLEYLRRLSREELYRMQPVPKIDDRLRGLAEEVGDPPELVQHDLAEFFRLDLKDYSRDYASAHRFYQTCGSLARRAVEFLDRMFPAPEVLYVLHRVLCSWEPHTLQASCGVIIEGWDYGEEDERFCQAIDGYLVSKGMAFGSEIEALAASFYDKWSSWDELWDRYYGWSEHWDEDADPHP
jgi:hypothetical protein